MRKSGSGSARGTFISRPKARILTSMSDTHWLRAGWSVEVGSPGMMVERTGRLLEPRAESAMSRRLSIVKQGGVFLQAATFQSLVPYRIRV